MVKLIVAADINMGIGYKNKLLYHMKEDLQNFKELTTGHTVVMGRKTLESLPNGPLSNRKNIVISSNKIENKGVTTLSSIDELKTYIENNPEEDIWIIGGATIYKQCLENNLVDELHVTTIFSKTGEYKEADSYIDCANEIAVEFQSEPTKIFEEGNFVGYYMVYKMLKGDIDGIRNLNRL